ncbi:hypothetical protein DPMN_115302 [Dreissena polymorpha]|uniref:CUB domain-containing protein n=1 Tax=Dreissena polymorpha TaxID=45954 RepID=A0A9D4KLG8_DREPO|nr:hypothetical protein DPMN_115302 [Dreissena polymorpha]
MPSVFFIFLKRIRYKIRIHALYFAGSYICENKLVSTYCPFRTGTDVSPTTHTSAEAITVILRSDNSFERYGFILKYWETTVTTTTTVTTPLVDSSTNIVLMVVSGLSGAGGVLALLAVWRTFKYFKGGSGRRRT